MAALGCRRPFAAALAAGLTLVPWSALAGEDEELLAAISRVEAAQYEDAALRLVRLLDAEGETCPTEPELSPEGCRLTNPELIKRARGYYAVTLYALGRLDDVRIEAEAILRSDPTYQPNPTVFPQKVMDIFVEVRGRLGEDLARIARERATADQAERDAEAARQAAISRYVATIEQLAGEERVTERRSRLVAMVPFGIGQIQNDDIGLGLFFGISQLAAGTTAIASAVAIFDLNSEAPSQASLDSDAANEQNDVLVTVNRVSMGLLLASAVAGVIEAQIAFPDDAPTVKPRKLPPRPPGITSLRPIVVPLEGGAAAGASGRF